MTYVRWTGLLMLSALVAGCFSLLSHDRFPSSVQAQFKDSEEMTVYSLEGGFATLPKAGETRPREQAASDPSEERLHGWKVLGKTPITDLRTRLQIGNAMRAGANSHDRSVVISFDPVHAIRIRSKNKVTDLMISFECGQVKVFENDQLQDSFFISKTPRPMLNEILRDANVPLSPRAQ